MQHPEIENQIERVLTCNTCHTNCESLLFHEARWHYEFYDFNPDTEQFICNTCQSRDIKEEFEIVDSDGNTTQYIFEDNEWKVLDKLINTL